MVAYLPKLPPGAQVMPQGIGGVPSTPPYDTSVFQKGNSMVDPASPEGQAMAAKAHDAAYPWEAIQQAYKTHGQGTPPAAATPAVPAVPGATPAVPATPANPQALPHPAPHHGLLEALKARLAQRGVPGQMRPNGVPASNGWMNLPQVQPLLNGMPGMQDALGFLQGGNAPSQDLAGKVATQLPKKGVV